MKNTGSLIKRIRHATSPLIILGEPGAGKTITLKQLGIELSAQNKHRVYPSLCLFIPLGRWKPVDEPSINDVEILIKTAAGPKLAPLLTSLADRQRLIIIFDGLDEMSRQKYNEHTRALSKYADHHTGQIKTLFSCRITDFSPAFRHNRLVLLPFKKHHILKYLTRQFLGLKINFSGKQISAKELSNRLVNQKLPIQPHNPFSLYLLALYLRENNCLPETRTELLTFFFHFQLERKKAEIEALGLAYSEKEKIFNDWAKLALLITKRNKGTDIELPYVRELFGKRTDLIVNTGRLCGVLQRTTDNDPTLVRFDHHRAQEFFTAFGIVEFNTKVNWAELLDLPRWQETLVNVTQMKALNTPLSILSERLSEIGVDDESSKDDLVSRSLLEAKDAERVELSTRILISLSPSQERINFDKEITRSSKWLVENGNPTTQVKMLRLTENLSDQGTRNIVDVALNSEVTWVRDQALEVAANISESISTSPLPLEIANSYADGSIVKSIKSKLKISRKIKSNRLAIVSVFSLLLFLIHLFLVSATVHSISTSIIDYVASDTHYYEYSSINDQVRTGVISSTESDKLISKISLKSSKFEEWLSIISLIVIIVSIICSLIWAPWAFWIAIPVTGFGVTSSFSAVYALWIYSDAIDLPSVFTAVIMSPLFLFFFIGYFSFIWFIIAMVISIFFSSLLALAIYLWTKKKSSLLLTYEVIIKGSRVIDYVSLVGPLWGVAISFILLGLGIQLITFLYYWLTSPGHWWDGLVDFVPDVLFLNDFFDLLLAAFLMISLIVVIIKTLMIFFSKEKRSYFKSDPIDFMGISSIITGIGFSIYTLNLILNKNTETKTEIDKKIPEDLIVSDSYSIAWIIEISVYILTMVLLVFLASAVIYMVYRLFIKYSPKIHLGNRYLNISSFKTKIEEGDPDMQSQLLRKTSLNELNLTPREFYAFLVELEPLVTKDPAISIYYQKRMELEEILRQERY